MWHHKKMSSRLGGPVWLKSCIDVSVHKIGKNATQLSPRSRKLLDRLHQRHRETKSRLRRLISNVTARKKQESVRGISPLEEESLLCHVLADAAPASEATVEIFYQKDGATTLFPVKLACCAFQTLGWRHSGSTETCYVFLLLFLYAGVYSH